MSFSSSLDDLDFLDSEPKNMEQYLELLRSKGVETTELEPILRASGKIMLTATAGAGKSTTLSYILGADKLFGILSPEKKSKNPNKGVALVSTFLRAGSEELSRSVQKNFGKLELYNTSLSDVSFKNLHSEMRQLLILAGVNLNEKSKPNYVSVLSDSDSDKSGLRTRILRKLCRDFQIGVYPEYPTANELNLLESVISLYRNTITFEFVLDTTQSDIKNMGLRADMLPAILTKYTKLKNQNKVIDFDDMVEKVYTYFANPETRNPKLYDMYIKRYSYVMIDEFQDTSELQYLALKPILENAEKVVIVGDIDQSIYSFNGARPEVMLWFRDEYNPSIYPLSVSYRCPSGILKPMAELIKRNTVRLNGDIKSFAEGGKVTTNSFLSVSDMAKHALQITNDALRNGKNVSIISRTNFSYSPALIHYVMQHGAKFNVAGNLVTLDKARYKRVIDLVELVRGRGVINLTNNLRVLTPDMPKYLATNVESAMTNNLSKDDNVVSYLSDFLDLRYRPTIQLFEKVRSLDRLSAFKEILNHVKFYGKPSDAEVVDTILTIAGVSQSVEEFVENVDFINNILKSASSRKNSNSPVTFATTHSFKGRESDVVIGFDTSAGVFPHFLTTEMFLEEERRNFFVLGTRAKEEIYYLCREGKESPFLEEAGLTPTPVRIVEERTTLKSNTSILRELKEKEAPVDREKAEEEELLKFIEEFSDL